MVLWMVSETPVTIDSLQHKGVALTQRKAQLFHLSLKRRKLVDLSKTFID